MRALEAQLPSPDAAAWPLEMAGVAPLLHALHTCQRAREEGTLEEWEAEVARVVVCGKEVGTRLYQRWCPCIQKSMRHPTTIFGEKPKKGQCVISDLQCGPPFLRRAAARLATSAGRRQAEIVKDLP